MIPRTQVQAYEVEERGKGRVFHVSHGTQDGFRVGKYFTVDPRYWYGKFPYPIALSNLDGIDLNVVLLLQNSVLIQQ